MNIIKNIIKKCNPVFKIAFVVISWTKLFFSFNFYFSSQYSGKRSRNILLLIILLDLKLEACDRFRVERIIGNRQW